MNSPTPTTVPSPLITNSPTALVSHDLHITKLQMFDGKTGWALHEAYISGDWEERILRTDDGIQTWKNVSPPTFRGYGPIPTISFVDANTAIAIYTKSLGPTSTESEITTQRTTDGGQTWQTGETIRLNQTPLIHSRQIMMLDRENGWMLAQSIGTMGKAYPTLFATQDGGLHWAEIYDTNKQVQAGDTSPLWLYGNYPYGDQAFTFISPTKGFYSNGDLFASQDGGKSWQEQTLPPPNELPDLEKSDLWRTTSLPQFMSELDGVLIRRVYPRDQVTLPQGTYYGLPLGQYLYFTHDAGQTWSPIPAPAKIGTVYFRDPRTGWFLGKSNADPSTSTQLYQTVDGGQTWTQFAGDCPLPLGSEIQFVDEQSGFAFDPNWTGSWYSNLDSRSGIIAGIFITTDGGHTWEKVTPQLTP